MTTPSTRSKTVMTSSSSGHYQPFDYLGCSNCSNDFISNESQNLPSFWLMECGHLSCVSCLGFPNASSLDTTQQYRCPINSCQGFQSAVYEVNGQIPLHPAIQEFFETPDSITQRLESVLTFQNRQMRLRIKNLHKLIESQRQTLRQNRSTLSVLPNLKQQINHLKRELNHRRSLQQEKSSDLTKNSNTRIPIHSNQITPSSHTSNHRPTINMADQNQQISHGINSDRFTGLAPMSLKNRHRRSWPSDSVHPSFNNSPILPSDSSAIPNHQTRTSNSLNPNTPARLPRTTSLGTNSEISRNNLRESEHDIPRRSSFGQMIDGRTTLLGKQGVGPQVCDRRLQVIPEDEDESTINQLPVRRVSGQSEPVKQMNRTPMRRSSNQVIRPVRSTQILKTQPMPIPGPSRLPHSTRAHLETIPNSKNQNPSYPSQHHAIPQSNATILSPFNTSSGFIYHEEQDKSVNKFKKPSLVGEAENQQTVNRSFPFNIKRPSTSNSSEPNFDTGNSRRRLNSVSNPQTRTAPYFNIARGHPP